MRRISARASSKIVSPNSVSPMDPWKSSGSTTKESASASTATTFPFVPDTRTRTERHPITRPTLCKLSTATSSAASKAGPHSSAARAPMKKGSGVAEPAVQHKAALRHAAGPTHL
eukprot:CAMPEP_0171650754 /NCGR_PEP_ID=MMETSP0990-20121206/37845_1 /TAXON_ID=483369 /ORGANISM="non described non described, Strain CCMP2098" /LENGTH=114 /DNA_ID=CAMNT_0012229439 /DNA_START=418 /DNA_END=761 /DNA_ORIENTATION=-